MGPSSKFNGSETREAHFDSITAHVEEQLLDLGVSQTDDVESSHRTYTLDQNDSEMAEKESSHHMQSIVLDSIANQGSTQSALECSSIVLGEEANDIFEAEDQNLSAEHQVCASFL